jgi:hypothetical protein
MGDVRKLCTHSVGKPEVEGKRPFGRHRRTRQKNIKTDLKEIEYHGFFIHGAGDRNQGRTIGNTIMNLRIE